MRALRIVMTNVEWKLVKKDYNYVKITMKADGVSLKIRLAEINFRIFHYKNNDFFFPAAFSAKIV